MPNKVSQNNIVLNILLVLNNWNFDLTGKALISKSVKFWSDKMTLGLFAPCRQMQSVLDRKLSEEWKHFPKQPTFWMSFSGFLLVLILLFLLASILNLHRKLVVAFTSYTCCQISQYRMSKNNVWNMYCRKYMARNYFADRWSDLWSGKKFPISEAIHFPVCFMI